MPLTRIDLDQIRAIVRDELRAIGDRGDRPPRQPTLDQDDDRIAHDVRLMLESMDREAAEREARPIPDGPVVDRYDAARLLGIKQDAVGRLMKKGRLTRRMVKGRLEVSRAEIDAIIAERPARKR